MRVSVDEEPLLVEGEKARRQARVRDTGRSLERGHAFKWKVMEPASTGTAVTGGAWKNFPSYSLSTSSSTSSATSAQAPRPVAGTRESKSTLVDSSHGISSNCGVVVVEGGEMCCTRSISEGEQ